MSTPATDSLTKETVFERIQDAVREFFKCPDEDVFPDTVAFDIDGWDSLAHATFMLALEERFAIRFNGTEVLEFQNVSDIVDCIYGHLLDGVVPHDDIFPKIAKKANVIDPEYETLIFNFNNSQVILAQQENGFWQELKKQGYTPVEGQGSRLDWQDNSVELPCKCNPKDILGITVTFASPTNARISDLQVWVNGKACASEPEQSANVFKSKFVARDFLGAEALEGKNCFRVRFGCSQPAARDLQLVCITVQRSRWGDNFAGTIKNTSYSGESLWGDLWRVGSRQFLMQMNDSFHNPDGTCAEATRWHAVGDSHANFNFAVYPECKTHHVNAHSIFHLIKNPFDLGPYKIPSGSKVVFVFGEIDCRTIIGSMAARVPPKEFIAYLVDGYATTVNSICKPYNLEAAVALPAPPFPKNTASDTEFPVVGTIHERAEYTRMFAEALRALKGRGCITGIIDAYTPYANEKGLLDRFFAADEAHLRPDRTDPLFAQARQWAGG